MNKRVYKTAQGVQVDIDHLRLLNEKVVAVGNMSVNARGDQVHPDGTIKTPRNEIMKNTYRTNAVVAGKGKVSSATNATKVTGAPAQPGTPAKKVTTPPPAVETKTEETTPTIMRGSLATSIVGNDSAPETTDLLSPSTTTRTIKRI